MNPSLTHPGGDSAVLATTRWGDQVVEMLSASTRDLLIVAPFITCQPLIRIVEQLPRGIPLTVVGRFLPEDVAAGVTQLESAEFLLSLEGKVDVRRNPVLHGKLYRGDDNCLVGSANLTLKGLGWSTHSNLELLIPSPRTGPIRSFETRVLEGSLALTEIDIRDIRARAREMLPPRVEVTPPEAEPTEWLPACFTPAVLFDVYAGVDQWKILASALEAAEHDLRCVGPIPENLDRASFEVWMAHSLRAHPLTEWVRARHHVQPEEAAKYIEEQFAGISTLLTPEMSWSVFQEWLLYFLANDFREVPTSTELVFGRKV